MRLTKHTDYAFRVLIYLASMPEDRLSTVQEIAEIMASHQIRRLPILNDDNELVGIVALGDLAVDASDERLGGDVLADV